MPPFPSAVADDDPLTGDDFHLALYICYELHYRGFAEVDEPWEWEPSLLAMRRELEVAFESALRAEIPAATSIDVSADLEALCRGDGPSLSGFMLERGTQLHFEEFAIHRSAYQLKEADPHTWGIPRLVGGPKSAMVLIQADEYGDGVAGASHAELFAETMDALGLDSSYGAYLDRLPATTLATVNLVSLFGLHRRLRGCLVGHLAMFEMTSVGPMGRYAGPCTASACRHGPVASTTCTSKPTSSTPWSPALVWLPGWPPSSPIWCPTSSSAPGRWGRSRPVSPAICSNRGTAG